MDEKTVQLEFLKGKIVEWDGVRQGNNSIIIKKAKAHFSGSG
jgi:hypothetical protein